jgi:hypothetical protein
MWVMHEAVMQGIRFLRRERAGCKEAPAYVTERDLGGASTGA